MKKSRKVFSIVIASILLMSSFMTGCGVKQKQQETGEAVDKTVKKVEEKAAEQEAEQELEPVKLTWYYVGRGEEKDIEMIEEAANEYMKDKINATIDMVCYDWGSYNDKLTLMIASGEEFDICFTAVWTNHYAPNVAKGAFLEVGPLMEQYAPKLKEVINPAFFEGTKIDGKNYAIPTNKELPHQWGVVVQKDIAEKHGIDLSTIKTYKDLEPILQIIKENEPDLYPIDHGFVFDIMDKIGGDTSPAALLYTGDDYTVFNAWEHPEMIEYLKDMRRWYKLGYFRADVINVQDVNADMQSGKAFMSSQSLKPGKDAELTASTGINWVQVPLFPALASTRDTMTAMQAISRTSKNPERAMMFLELINTDKYMNNLINFGIEGVHYVKKSDDIIEFPEGVDASSSGYLPGIAWAFANQFENYLWSNEDPNKWENYKAFNESATVSKAMGFSFNPEPVKVELAACAAVSQEYQDALTNGVLDPEEHLPKFIDKLKAAGSEKVIAETQKQLDAWLETKN